MIRRIRQHLPQGLPALACMVALALGTVGCKKDEKKKNRKCESDCVSDYAGEIEDCESDIAECLSHCDGPDDWDCTDACEDYQFDCMFSFTICSATCDCLSEASSCGFKCDGTDLECPTDCLDEYTSCAGEDSPYLCATECQLPSYSCSNQCDQMGYDSPDFVSCREDCASDIADCLKDCD